MPSVTTTTADLARDDTAVWRAQLVDMPLWVVLRYLRDVGILSESYCRQDVLPPADDGPYKPELVPFEHEGRG